MSRLLLIEADPRFRHSLEALFTSEGHFCAAAQGAEAALRSLEDGPFDLVILDLGDPPADGLSLLRRIRARHGVPILILAPNGKVSDTVAGLDLGADDYFCEPFDPRELAARVRAHLRRADGANGSGSDDRRIDLGGVLLDLDQRDAFRGTHPLNLTTREFDLLHLLARYLNRALASDAIYEHIWGHSGDGNMKALAVYVGRLRRKIETDPAHPRRLVSIRGFGYQLVRTPETIEPGG